MDLIQAERRVAIHLAGPTVGPAVAAAAQNVPRAQKDLLKSCQDVDVKGEKRFCEGREPKRD